MTTANELAMLRVELAQCQARRAALLEDIRADERYLAYHDPELTPAQCADIEAELSDDGRALALCDNEIQWLEVNINRACASEREALRAWNAGEPIRCPWGTLPKGAQ